MVKNSCVDCGKQICEHSLRCVRCSNLFRFKDKKYEDLYGKEKAHILRKQSSLRIKGDKNPSKRKDVKLKNSLWHKGRSPGNKGKKYKDYMTEKQIKNCRIAQQNKNYKHSNEMKLKISKLCKGINNGFYGKKHTLENIERFRKNTILYIVNNPKFTETSIERKTKKFLEKLNIKFFHPYWINNIKHHYAADFYLPKQNLVIECDGDYWHRRPEIIKKDKTRNKEMKNVGYKVLRLWERDINNMSVEQFNERLNLCL